MSVVLKKMPRILDVGSQDGAVRSRSCYWKSLLLVVLAFLVGFANAKGYLQLLDLQFLSRLLTAMLVFILFLSSLTLLKSKGTPLKYIVPLFVLVLSKYAWLYFVNPGLFSVSGPEVNTNFAQGYYLFHTSYRGEVFYLLIGFFLCCVVARGANSFRELRWIVGALVLGSGIAPLIGFFFFHQMVGFRETMVDGILFPGGFWNSSVISFISVFWLAVAVMPYASKLGSWILKIFLFFITMGALVGLSRAALVSMSISSMVYLVMAREGRARIKLTIFFLLIILICLLFFSNVVGDFQSRFIEKATLADELRLQIWMGYLSNFSQYWMSGMGEDGYLAFSATRQGAHSIILSYLVRFGFLGVVFFLWLLYGVWVSIVKIQKAFPSKAIAAICAWLTAYLCLVTYNETGFAEIGLYMPLGLLLAWGEIASRYGLCSETCGGR
ncbi:MAG: O-antigen ligase family protein [Candidatus Omnitrophota bacterium]